MFIGVTGGVGTGKSTILGIIRKEYNAHIIMADDVARYLMDENDGRAFKAVMEYFGDEILDENGNMDREKLSKIVFKDEKKLETINSIVHPLVRQEIIAEKDQILAINPERLVVLEAALLIETGYKEILDELWGVVADKEIRKDRLKKQRGYSDEKSESIIANQISDEEIFANCDFVINNSNDLDDTRKQIVGHLERIFNR